MKIKADFIVGVFLFLVSVIALLFPIFGISSIPFLLNYFLLTYIFLNALKFFMNRKTKDYEGLYTSIVCILLYVSLFFVPLTKPLALSLFVFMFVIFISFIHLKKADFYHDRKEKIWMLEVTTLIVFAIAGLLTSFSILLESSGSFFMIGFLFFINGFIEIIDPVVNYILK